MTNGLSIPRVSWLSLLLGGGCYEPFNQSARRADRVLSPEALCETGSLLTVARCCQHLADGGAEMLIRQRGSWHHLGRADARGAKRDARLVAAPGHEHHRHTVVQGP